MVMKKKLRGRKKIEEDEFEEEDDMEDEEDLEEEIPKDTLPPVPQPLKETIKKPNRPEIEDMIEGHLLRATELLRLLRSTP